MAREQVAVPDIGGAEGAEVIEILVAVGDEAVDVRMSRIDFAVPPAELESEVLAELGRGIWNTIAFATAAMVLAGILGIVLGFLASTAWWSACVDIGVRAIW